MLGFPVSRIAVNPFHHHSHTTRNCPCHGIGPKYGRNMENYAGSDSEPGNDLTLLLFMLSTRITWHLKIIQFNSKSFIFAILHGWHKYKYENKVITETWELLTRNIQSQKTAWRKYIDTTKEMKWHNTLIVYLLAEIYLDKYLTSWNMLGYNFMIIHLLVASLGSIYDSKEMGWFTYSESSVLYQLIVFVYKWMDGDLMWVWM